MQTNHLIQKTQLDTLGKGLGCVTPGSTFANIGSLGWSILNEDVSLPVAVLRQSRIIHNLTWMKQFIESYRVELAPHGKTTMSPELFHMQLDHGAWGITLATASQVQAAAAHGVPRIIMANQLVGKGNMAIIARLQQADPDFYFCCIVDSAENADALGQYFSAHHQKLKILLEYGVAGGRTGIRDSAQEQAVLEAIACWPQALSLVGVELYEGVLSEEQAIRDFLKHVLARTQALALQNKFCEPRVILSGAGSAWFDVVAEEFGGKILGSNQSLQVILRPGCYLTHDVGVYLNAEKRIQASNPVAREMGRSLQPALQLWAYVQAIPETNRAIIALGKRDAAFDAGFPITTLHFRPGMHLTPQPAPGDWTITAMMDQHAFMSIPSGADLKVGDMLAFDISHPCLTFDKWRQILLVDDQYQVTAAVQTLF
jgi:D-serine dehydratase